MTVPHIRCATMPNGDIEATSFNRDFPTVPYRMVCAKLGGEVLEANVKLGTDMYRWLAHAARQHCTAW